MKMAEKRAGALKRFISRMVVEIHDDILEPQAPTMF